MLGAYVGAVEFHVAPVNPLFSGDPLQALAGQIPGVAIRQKARFKPMGPM